MHSNEGVREFISFAPHGAPVRILWYRDAILPPWSFGYHPELELQFVRRGTIVYTVHDKKYILHANSLLMIYPNELHALSPAGDGQAMNKITLMVQPSFAGLRTDGRIPGARSLRHLRLNVAEAQVFRRIASDLQRESDRRESDWITLSCLMLQELFVRIKRASIRSVEPDADNPVIATVLEAINCRYAEPLTNTVLARTVGLSTSRLTHLFSQHMGISLKQYILHLRITKAAELLVAEPALKVEAVAQDVGFRYVADFNRNFKMRKRMTPTEYRHLSAIGHVPAL